jgi:hypothetical protein
MGGQACILYGAAEFSRDIDLAVNISPESLKRLESALREMEAKRIFVPDLSEDILRRGHASHFRCGREEFQGLRIDVMGAMRGVDPFPRLWERRKEVELPHVGRVAVMGLWDLVRAKKTQRDKDWPMIRRLVENDIVAHAPDPTEEKVSFWLMECRTPQCLAELAAGYPEIARALVEARPLLRFALDGKKEELRHHLRLEEERERELDEQYWAPLKQELAQWRRRDKALE